MSKTLRLMSNARIELGRLGERDDVIQAYIDALRSLAQIEDQTVEEKISILRPLLYGNKLKDPDIEPEKDIPMTADCCGPGYRPGDEGCNHSVQAEPPIGTKSLGGSALVQHAVRELELIGEDEDTIRGLVAVVRAFSDMHHSGGSAEVAIPMLEKLLRYEPLSPLTHKPSEWRYIPAEMWGEVGGAWQNIRDSKVFTTKDPSLKVVPREPFCDCCGPGYRPGDEGCNHTLTKMSSESEFTPDFIFIGNECFAMGDRSAISYKGEQYYRACNHFVADRVDGGVEFCVKRVGHPGSDHESYSGIVLHTIKENI